MKKVPQKVIFFYCIYEYRNTFLFLFETRLIRTFSHVGKYQTKLEGKVYIACYNTDLRIGHFNNFDTIDNTCEYFQYFVTF